MKIFLRSLLVILAPALALSLTLLASALFIVFVYFNPVMDEINAAVQQHFVDHENVPITVFNNNIFLAAKDIAKGQKLSVDMLERETYSGKDEDPAKVNRSKETILGATARDAIAKGKLIFASDLSDYVHSDQKSADPDTAVKETPANGVFLVMLAIWALSGIGAAFAIFGSQIWIIVLAFRKSILWGISSLLLPLAATIYEIRNWEQTKKAFKIQVVGFALLGLLLGSLIGVKVKTDVLDGELATTITALYAQKDVPEGAVISESDFTGIQTAKSMIPEDALHEKSEAIGHKARFGLSKGLMIRAQDISK